VQSSSLEEGKQYRVTALNGDISFLNFLQTLGIVRGTVLTKNYSPSYAKLVNFSISGKMISLKASDFDHLKFEEV
jgi:Fe2+ transport system protein FeoA